MISILNKKNPGFSIYDVTDDSFKEYGSILKKEYFEEAFDYLDKLEIPKEGNQYIAHDEKFLSSLSNTKIYDDAFGFSKIQFGYVNGNNEMLNALEYHKSSEINICLTDLVLFLGKEEDIQNNELCSDMLKAYYVPAKTVIELKAGVLHFSPCKVNETGFKCGVILPYGTNQEFVSSNYKTLKRDELLFKSNKWLLCHYESQKLIQKGAYPGLKGVNYKLKY